MTNLKPTMTLNCFKMAPSKDTSKPNISQIFLLIYYFNHKYGTQCRRIYRNFPNTVHDKNLDIQESYHVCVQSSIP